MAKSKFIVTATLKLVPDASNLSGITKAINKALKQVPKRTNIDLKVRLNQTDFKAVKNSLNQLTKNINVKHVEKLNSSLKQTSNETRVLGADFAALGHQAALATRRFGGFVVGTFAIRELGFAFKETFRSALEFQESLVKVGQVTKTSLKDLKLLESSITKVSTSLGVDSEQLITAAQTLSQSGLTLEDTRTSLEALAKTTLSPSFGSLEDTTEGLISAMAQFNFKAGDAEATLSSINAIAAKTAVESEDLIDVIKRTGGAFQATGGDLNELLALFTSVRATTRESAGTIGTGFRTIFTRLQRPGTIDFLSSLGIELRDVNNQFIGGYEAIRKLSSALNQIPTTDPRFAQIVEELGGIRQISKVIPLVKEFGKAEEALAIAMTGRDSIQQDVARSQESMLRQFREIKEEFKALVREFANNTAVKQFINLMLEVARSLIKVGDAIVPLLPLFVALGAKTGIGALGKFLVGTSARGQRAFIPTLTGKGFKSGGSVGGIGTGDKIPAMLEPGEFVLKKSVARKVGYGTLNAINDGVVRKFQKGGIVGSISNSAGTLAAAGIGVALVNTFSGLNDSVQKLTGILFSVGAQLFLFNKAVKLNNPDATSSPVRGTRGVKFDRIIAKDVSSLGRLTEKDKQDRRGIQLRKESIGNLFGFLKQTEREGQRRLDEISITNESTVETIQRLTPIVSKLDSELASNQDREKNLRFLSKNEAVFEKRRLKELTSTRGQITRLSSKPNETTEERNRRLLEQAQSNVFFRRNPNLKGTVPQSIIQKAVSGSSSKGVVTKEFNALLAADQAAEAKRAQKLSELRLREQQLQRPTLTGPDRIFLEDRNQKRLLRSKLSKGLEVARARQFLDPSQDVLLSQRERAARVARDLGDEVSGLESGLLSSTDLETRRRRIRKLRGGRRLQRIGANISRFGPGAAAIASIGGDFLSSFGNERIAAGDFSGRTAAVAGGALSGAGQGALVGSMFGPIGIAVGAAVGGLAGFTNALINTRKQIESIQFDKSIKDFTKIFDSISAGRTKATSGTFATNKVLSTIQSRISTTTGEDLITARGQFENLSPAFSNFFNTIAQSSTSFDQFNKNVGDSVRKFSELSGIPLEDLNNQYRKQIEAQREGIKTQELLNRASFEYGLQLRAGLSFLEGLSESATRIEDFGNSISDISSIISGTGGGNIGIENIPGIRSQQFSGRVGGLSGFFGPEASGFLNELQLASKALEILPDIIIDLKSSRLSEEGDIDLRLRKALSSNLGVSPSNDVINKLINTFRKIGGEEGEPKFLSEVDTNFAGVIEEFSNSFEDSQKIFGKGVENIQGILSKYADSLQTVAASEQEIVNLRLRSLETLTDAEKTLAGVFERDIDFSRLSQISDVQNGPNNPRQLGAIIAASTSRAIDIQDRIRSGQISGFAEGKELIDARQAELITINKAKLALERLADTSNTTSVNLDALAKLRQDRDTKREFASSFVFGDSAQRREIGLSIQAATLAASQNSLQNIPDTLKDSVLQTLRQFSDVRLGAFGGRTGLEVEKDILQGTATAAGLSQEEAIAFAGKAGGEEQRLQQAIVDGINTSMEAQRTLQEIAVSDQKTLISVTQEGFKFLAVDFRNTILEGQKAGLESRLLLSKSNIGTLTQKQAAFNQLSQLGLKTPEQIATFKGGTVEQAQKTSDRIFGLQSLFTELSKADASKNQEKFNQVFLKNRQKLFDANFTFEEVERIGKFGVGGTRLAGGPTTGNFETRSNVGALRELFIPKLKEAGQDFGKLDLSAFGGVVPRFNNDKINNLLSVIGDSTPSEISKQLKEQGGTVGLLQNEINQIDKLKESNIVFGESISQFNNSASTLAQTLSSFPSEVGHNVNGRVEVVINGAQAFETIGPQIAELIDAKIGAAINDFTRNNFPQLKPSGPNRQVRPR